MATLTWVGTGGSANSWSGTPTAGDTLVFTDTNRDVTTDLDALADIDLQAVIFTDTFGGRVGNELQGLELEVSSTASAAITNGSRSPYIHIAGGAVENIENIYNNPANPNGSQLDLSGATVGFLYPTGGTTRIAGDCTVSTVLAAFNAYVQALDGVNIAALGAHGRAQVDLWEALTADDLVVADNAIVRMMQASTNMAQGLRLLGGTFVYKGGTITTNEILGGVLDCSSATANVTLTGGTAGPDARIEKPKQPYVLTASLFKLLAGGPQNWPA